MRKFCITILSLILSAGIAQADIVANWDMSNVTPVDPTNVTNPDFIFDQFNYVEPGSLIDPNTGAVATGGFMPSGWVKYAVGASLLPNGAMTWKERDTQGPGLSVVTNDDMTGVNCIMSAGWMPESPWGTDIKQCSDPWQSSKRFKAVGYVLDGPVDLTFDVDVTGQADVYRILQKYGNHTGSRVTGYTTQLGFLDANGNFSEAAPGTGIAFCLKNGTIFDNNNPTSSSMANQGELDSLMAHGLFGAPDKHHLTAGYFNPYVRATFGLSAGETYITTTGLAAVHRDLFGEWLPGDQMKGGFFFDDDNNPYTDNALMANCEGNFDEAAALAGAANAGCDGTWMTRKEGYVITQNADGSYNIPPSVGTDVRAPIEVPVSVISSWMSDPMWIPGDIDDLANVNINQYISISNADNWPTADGNGNASFTLRITPTFDLAAAQTEPGVAGPADFVVNVTAPTAVQ